jgi:hypothetical protein
MNGELTESQHAQRKPHRIILIRRQEENSIPEPAPDKHVRHDPSHEVRAVERNGADPVQSDEVPGQRAGNRADVDGARGGAVAEVGEAEVEEVDDEQQLREPEVRAHPEVDEAEQQEIGGDVVGADVGGGEEVGLVCGPEGVGVDELEGEED